MFRRGLAVAVVLCFVGSVVVAGTYNGVITKLSDKEVTVKVFKDKDDKEGKEMTFKVNKDTKYYVGQGKDKDPKESSLGDVTKAVETAVEKSKAKGLFSKIETDGEGDKEVVTKITTRGGKKKN
jgi:hypothetical protein